MNIFLVLLIREDTEGVIGVFDQEKKARDYIKMLEDIDRPAVLADLTTPVQYVVDRWEIDEVRM